MLGVTAAADAVDPLLLTDDKQDRLHPSIVTDVGITRRPTVNKLIIFIFRSERELAKPYSVVIYLEIQFDESFQSY